MAGPVRIGDAERDHAASALGEHYATGRLTKEEYEERSERVWAAKFQTDLEPLFSDLPSPWTRELTPARPVRPQRPTPFAPLAPLFVIGLVVAVLLTGMPWLLFGLFWLGAIAGCGQRRADRLQARPAAVGPYRLVHERPGHRPI
jgi:hypothetical protein